MCRLLSIIGKPKDIAVEELLGGFKRLAEFGSIPPDTSRGHKDGWGLVFYAHHKSPKLFMENKDAYTSVVYDSAARKILATNRSVLIGHLRKSSVGKKCLENTQPFLKKGCSFAHNGTIYGSKKITLQPSFIKLLKGDTDSERFFVLILQNLFSSKKKDLKQALLSAVRFTRKNFDYTALNLIFFDGKKNVFVLREINPHIRKKELLDYYSLFVGTDGAGGVVVSSEKLTDKLKWEPLKNHELIKVAVIGGSVKKFRV